MEEDFLSAEYEEEESSRLDKAIVQLFAELNLSRTKAQSLIEKGLVSLNNNLASKSSLEVVKGDLVEVSPDPNDEIDLAPYNFELDVVFEDESLLVVNKPAGLTVHPGAGNKSETLVNALIFRQTELSTSGESYRPGIVHRLDKDTTGLMVVAKTDAAHANLAEQFKERSASRIYQALCALTPRRKGEIGTEEEGFVDIAIGRDQKSRTKMAVDGIAAKSAKTHWTVIERLYYAVRLHLKLDTGRTHQIRVHMNHIGAPVLGDPLYGDFSSLPKPLFEVVKNFGRQALHAGELSFIHPVTKEDLSFKAELPADFQDLIKAFRSFDKEYESI